MVTLVALNWGLKGVNSGLSAVWRRRGRHQTERSTVP